MYGHKSFLMLGSASADIGTLTGKGLEILSYNLTFDQGVDTRGKATSSVIGGTISVVLSMLPTDEILLWGIKPKEYRSGAIILVNEENQPIDKVLFENAACIGLQFDHTQRGSAYSSTRLVIQAEEIKLGLSSEVNFRNRWVEP